MFDLYTKIILTVIAVNLCFLSLSQGFEASPAFAASDEVKLVGHKISRFRPLPVEIVSTRIPSQNAPLRVKIVE